MELRVLTYFLTVSREENITKAAQLLHITQPTLSRQMMQLEEELGVKLFERGSHSITLTKDGLLLKRRAQEIVSLADKTKQDFMKQEENLAGEISIGAGEFLSIDYLAGVISSFRRKHPYVQFDLHSGNADHIKDYIERGLLDMGLLLEPVEIGKYEFARMPTKEQWGVLVHKDSELAANKQMDPHDLCGYPLIISKGTFLRGWLADCFGEDYEHLEIVATYNLLYNAAIMVQNKMGAAVCLNLHSTYDNLCFIPFTPELKAGSVLVWKKSQPFSSTTSAFILHLNEMLKRHSME